MIGKKGVMVLAKLGTHFFTIKVAQAAKKKFNHTFTSMYRHKFRQNPTIALKISMGT